VPVLGIIENMSLHVCSECGHEEHIFGSGGAQRMADQYGSELLGELPLDMRIRVGAETTACRLSSRNRRGLLHGRTRRSLGGRQHGCRY
jgi:hypothetical protein